MNYEEALEYIHGISWTFCKPGLERISALCKALGDPQKKLKFIHIAGTNGKGSTSAMLESVLRESGYKTGLFTSPYIRTFNERMRVDGENISDGELAEITEYVRPFADAMTDKPTEFELISAIAFEYFSRNNCDVVVLEAGMGGRLDSTNVIDSALLSIITGIALDHTAFLGDTVEKIAAEKAGIIKCGCPVLFGGEDDAAERVIRERAAEMNAPFSRVDRSSLTLHSQTLDGTVFDFGGYKNMQIRMLGSYQPRNAATVLSAIDILKERGFSIPDSAISRGLDATRWQARFEVISNDPLVIFDGAHNPEGIAAAVESIRHYFRDKRVHVLTGVLRDKDYNIIASDISKVASRAFTLTPDNPRALSAEEYAEVLKEKGVEATPYPDIENALSAAREAAKRDGEPLICMGSLYLYSSIIDYFI
ncbi:MAG: bifunctional folylpolyglutamate synthase/dihydrofolate synthase [Clostridia bacterium]|nr:bifunctional folylpolyglutamate synthase/dihydrofolate synthase [Clostridia bacterium]